MNSILNANKKSDLEYFFEISVDLMAIIGRDKNFKKVSKSWTEVLGWSEDILLLSNWDEYVHEDDIIRTKEFIHSDEITNGARGLEVRYKCENQEYRWIECNCKYIEHEEIYIVTARDITERKAIHEEKIAYEKAIELESIKSEFFSNVSHEFKTPLNIILATMQLINKNIEDEKIITKDGINIDKYMNSIKQNCYRLLRLVNNIIDVSKIDYGYYDIQLGNYNIVSVIEDITMSVLEYVNQKGINLVFDTEIEEEIIACDPDKIERIILNLLSNAIKYTDKGGTIRVDISKNNNEKVLISITDTGIGIPQEKLDTIFERYRQVDNKITRNWNGSGIGLSLVKSLVEMQGGSIHAESKISEGSKFIIELPIRVVKELKENNKCNNLTASRVEKCNIEFSDIYK